MPDLSSAFIFLAIGVALCAVGYILNFFRIFGALSKESGAGVVIIRIVGIFILPIGVIAGFIPNKSQVEARGSSASPASQLTGQLGTSASSADWGSRTKMTTVGAVISAIAGILGILGAAVEIGSVGVVVALKHGSQDVWLGAAGLIACCAVIPLGALSRRSKRGREPATVITLSLIGAVLGSTSVAVSMILAFVGGILSLVGGASPRRLAEGAVDGRARLEPSMGTTSEDVVGSPA